MRNKIILKNEHIELLKSVNISFDNGCRLSDDELIAFEDSITDYVLREEVDDDVVTEKGESLLCVYDYIIDNFDS